ncbi:MAG TPA: cytochrome-c peroxidase, partial [bacterium]|nr:cytochrome-c peroxidase [bacterium]
MASTSVAIAVGVVAVALVASAEVPKPGPLAKPVSAAQVGAPQDLVTLVTPGGKPASADVVALGQKLFFDGRLSADGTVACATCHDPEKGFTDQLPTSKGIRGQKGPRNAPTVLNAMFFQTQFWDGRAGTLEDQAKLPILNPIEMGQKAPEDVVAAVAKIPEYAEAFPRLFGRAATYDDIAAAIAAYERSQPAFDAPFDRFLAGDEKAISAAAKRGWTLFNGRGRCVSCHGVNGTRPLFTDDKFHNVGVAAHKSDFGTLARKAGAAVTSGSTDVIDRLALEPDFS